MIKRAFGRREEWDPRNARFGVEKLVDLGRPLRSRTWECNLLLDQGRDSTCVGCAWTYELAARPVPVAGLDYAYARDQIYMMATTMDQWSDNDRDVDGGTSTQAGAKSCVAHGYVKSYYWGLTEEQVALGIGYRGPAVLGLRWYEGMCLTDVNGYLTLSGAVVGGHEILARGFDVKTKTFRLRNSWGKWGINGTGDCFLRYDDLARLLSEGGDACVPQLRVWRNRKPVFMEF